MTTEFNLSEKITKGCNHYDFEECIFREDVKEFIRLNKELDEKFLCIISGRLFAKAMNEEFDTKELIKMVRADWIVNQEEKQKLAGDKLK